MTQGARAPARWWTLPRAGQATYLAGADPALLRIELDPLPPGAPAVVQFLPHAGVSMGDQVAVILDEMDRAAVALFPRWLPGAERLEASADLGVPAVRHLAAGVAARSRNFGPFLADLAARALSGARARSPFPPEVRARGLARVIADAYGRESTGLLIEVPDRLVPAGEPALAGAAEWLAYHGHLTVWLAGAPLRSVDRLASVPVTLPEYLTQLDAQAPPTVPGPPAGTPAPIFRYPPLSGLPRADSAAEQRLERALAPHEWARGRRWNHTYEWHLLGKPYRLDLFWPDEGLVVEVDGPDHRERLKYTDDRRRDVHLQLRGNAVLRFTNEEVLGDVQDVVGKIERLLSRRRADIGDTPAPPTHRRR